MLFIQNGLLHTMEADQPIRGELLVKEGKIAALGPQLRPPEGARILDAAGGQVFPGFIDAHSHIGLTREKLTPLGDESNENTQPMTPCMRAIDAIIRDEVAYYRDVYERGGLSAVIDGFR